MERRTMTADHTTDVAVTAIALGVVITIAVIGFMLAWALPQA